VACGDKPGHLPAQRAQGLETRTLGLAQERLPLVAFASWLLPA